MKYFIYYIVVLLSSFLIINKTYAEDILSLDKPIIEFNEIKNYGLQGYTVVADKLFLVLEGYDDTESIIKVFDLNTYKEVLSYYFGSLGHANDVAYNKNTNKIYVIASGGSDLVYTFNGNNFMYEDSFRIGLPVRSITYIDKIDKYAVRTIASGFIYNNEFILDSKIPFIVGMNFSTEVGRQGWSYYNNYIYYASWSWKRYGGDGSNVIFIYDLDGNKYNNIYTSKDIGELEGIDFFQDKMILGFNGYDHKVKFYISDIPEVEEVSYNTSEEDTIVAEENNENNYIVYVSGILCIIIVTVIILMYRKK